MSQLIELCTWMSRERSVCFKIGYLQTLHLPIQIGRGGYAPFSGTIVDTSPGRGRTLEVLLSRDHADFAGLQASQLCGCCMSWLFWVFWLVREGPLPLGKVPLE